MIKSFRHRGLKQFYERGTTRYLKADQVSKIRRILGLLESASQPQSLDLPGVGLHALKGDLKGFWSLSVSGNWRMIFHFENGNAYNLDLVDYH
jgi:proteic killer suppression protein